MTEEQFARLHETLIDATAVAQHFSDLLEQEKKHLTSSDRETVSSLLEQKQTLIQQLSDYQQTILGFCQIAQIEPSYGALRALLYRNNCTNAEAVLTAWTSLKNCLIKNQALNKTNEAILNELIRRNQIKQAIVHNLGRQSDTYSANGQKPSHAGHGWVEQV